MKSEGKNYSLKGFEKLIIFEDEYIYNLSEINGLV